MSNILLGFNNYIDTATLSGGSWNATLVQANIKNKLLAKVARTTNAANTSSIVNIDLGSAKTVKAIGALATNMSSTGATYRIRGSNDSTFTTSLYDSLTSNLLTTTSLYGATSLWQGNSSMVRVDNKTQAPDGTWTAGRVSSVNTTYGTLLRQYLTWTALTYTFSIHVKKDNWSYVGMRISMASNGDRYVMFNLDTQTFSLNGVTGVTFGYIALTNGWFRIYITTLATAGYAVLDFVLSDSTGSCLTNLGAGNSAFVWGEQLEIGGLTDYKPSIKTFGSRGTTGTYYNSTGILQTAAINSARLSYNPSNLTASPALLLEPAATNLMVQSNSFPAAYNPNTATFTANAAVSPDGTTNATTVTSTVLSPYHFGGGAPITANTLYTHSLYIKDNTAAVGTWQIYFGDSTSTNGVLAQFASSATGDITSATTGVVVQKLPNGWNRISCTYTPTGTSSASIVSAVTGTPRNFAFYGQQVETGGVATSYIPTTTAAVPKSADVFTSQFNAGNQSPHIIVGIPTGVAAQYWRLEIFDASNPSGYCQIGRVFIGDGFTPTINYSYENAFGYRTTTGVVTSIGEIDYFDKRPLRKSMQLSIDWLTNAEEEAVHNLISISDINGEVLVIPDPSDTTYNQRNNFLARMNQLSPIQNPYYNINKTAFDFLEII